MLKIPKYQIVSKDRIRPCFTCHTLIPALTPPARGSSGLGLERESEGEERHALRGEQNVQQLRDMQAEGVGKPWAAGYSHRSRLELWRVT